MSRQFATELPLYSTAGYSTSSPEQASRHLGPHLVPHRVNLLEPPRPLTFRHCSATVGDVGFNALRYGADVAIDAEPLHHCYLLLLLYAGRGELHQGKQVMQATTDTVCVFNPGEASRLYLSADQRNLTVRIPSAILERQAPQAPVPRFNAAANGRVHASGLRSFVSHVCAQLSTASGSLEHPLVARNVEDMLASLMLAELPTINDDTHASGATPRHVSRAEAFMRENYRLPLTLSQIADACGISARALQKGFNRHRGTTPMQALLEIRLCAADQALRYRQQLPVTAVALDCGFTHMGRFAQAYQRRFGTRPSTARRGF